MLPELPEELTLEQKEQLDAARKAIPLLKAQLRKAANAGIDVTQQQAELDALQTQLDKLYRVYVRPTSTTRAAS